MKVLYYFIVLLLCLFFTESEVNSKEKIIKDIEKSEFVKDNKENIKKGVKVFQTLMKIYIFLKEIADKIHDFIFGIIKKIFIGDNDRKAFIFIYRQL